MNRHTKAWFAMKEERLNYEALLSSAALAYSGTYTARFPSKEDPVQKIKKGDQVTLVDGYMSVPKEAEHGNGNGYVEKEGCVAGVTYTVTDAKDYFIRLGGACNYWLNRAQFKLAAPAAPTNSPKEDTMTKSVKQLTLINGTDASTMSLDQYLAVLEQRGGQIATLKKSAASKSAAVKKQIAKLEADQKDVTVLMDQYHGQDD